MRTTTTHLSRGYIFILLLISLFLGLQSCTSYKMHVSTAQKDWEEKTPDPALELDHRIYLIGDAGLNGEEEVKSLWDDLKEELANAPEESTVLFLGNNVDRQGMPPKREVKDRALAESQLMQELELVNDFPGKPIFIPGQHEWMKWGTKGLDRQEKFVESYLNKDVKKKKKKKNYFYPKDGCPGPEVVEVTDQLVLIIVDSQWWLANWDKVSNIHDGCEIKNRSTFRFVFEQTIRKYSRKNVVVALHHPIYSNGPRGGDFTFTENLFPLTRVQKGLYLPLPIVGNIANFIQSRIGSRQDLSHKEYQALKEALLFGATKNGSFTFVSSHENNLQYLQNDGQHFVVSGSSKEKRPSRLGNGAGFSYGEYGYAVLDYFEDGSSWLKFMALDEDSQETQLVFQTQLSGPLPSQDVELPTDFPEYESGVEYLETSLIKRKVEEKSGFYDWLVGKHYRDVYLPKYKVPVLDLSEYKGGLEPIKRGGGNQTNSLRLEDENGRNYTMRDMTKDASRLLPFPLNKVKSVQAAVEESFLAGHPFSPFAIPDLADAVKVYHTDPKLFYVPKQPVLGIYNQDYGQSVYLVEERPDDDWEGSGLFGDSEEIISTADVVDNIRKSHEYKVDQRWTLRSRLFDVLLGDWDRHDDQWRWSSFEVNKDSTYYRPIPRDRDQAFSLYDGFLTDFGRLLTPVARRLHSYSPKVNNIKWLIWSARHFDQSFLNEMDWSDWEAEAQFMQKMLSDELIESAFKTWPQAAYDASAESIINDLKSRRDQLPELARKFYEQIATKVDVNGTNDDDRFVIDRLSPDQLRVRVYELSKGGKNSRLVYDRTFDRAVTKEIDIYGEEDDDEFIVNGDIKNKILVRLIGGSGNDKYPTNAEGDNLTKGKIQVYDSKKEDLDSNGALSDRREIGRRFNVYDRKALHYEFDFAMTSPIIGVNPDDGIFLGATHTWVDYGFKKAPYSASQSLSAGFAFATRAISLDYQGDFLQLFGRWGLQLDVLLKGPTYTFNYFGFGNDAPRLVDDINFYRVRQSQLHIAPALQLPLRSGEGHFKIGPFASISSLDKTAGRFIADPENGLEERIFENQYFAGAEMEMVYQNLDNIVVPHRGIDFRFNLSWTSSMNASSDAEFTSLRSSVALYQYIDNAERLIFATRLGFSHNFEDDFEFFQAATLGGNANMRGFFNQRFYGQTAFWQNIDLRYQLFSSYNSAIPFTMGLFAGFDYGRVWESNDQSDTWHQNIGGGIWLTPVDAFALSLGVFIPEEEEGRSRFVVKMGLQF